MQLSIFDKPKEIFSRNGLVTYDIESIDKNKKNDCKWIFYMSEQEVKDRIYNHIKSIKNAKN